MSSSPLALVDELSVIDSNLLQALAARGFEALAVSDAEAAREAVLSLIPDGALVSHGGSTTLEEIGLIDELASSERVRYGNAEWLAEDDATERLELRKHRSIFADVYQVAFPLEDVRMRRTGGTGSSVNKLVVYDRDPVPGRTTLILVRQALGF